MHRKICKMLTLIFLMNFKKGIAQDNYEIQVYGSQTQKAASTMFELHSNFTFAGSHTIKDGVLPTHHAEHETLEITTGVNSFLEIGAYLFTAIEPGHGYQIVGTHIRPRIMAPLAWNWPVGVSLSTEIGYQKAAYASQLWSLEIRPIIDKQWQKWYASFNPTVGISLKSKFDRSAPTFEPNVKAYYTVSKNSAVGVEYYGDIGYIDRFESWNQQTQALFIAYDLLNNIHWEFNAGAGLGLTQSTDHFVFKVIVGRRINWRNDKRIPSQ